MRHNIIEIKAHLTRFCLLGWGSPDLCFMRSTKEQIRSDQHLYIPSVANIFPASKFLRFDREDTVKPV